MGTSNNNQALTIEQGIERLASTNNIEIGNWYLIDTSDASLVHRTHDRHKNDEITTSESSALVCANRFESNLVVLSSNECEYRVLSRNMDKVLKSVDQVKAFEMVNLSLVTKRNNIELLQREMQSVIQNVNPKKPPSESKDIIVATKDALIEKSSELKNVYGSKVEKIGKEIENNISSINAISKYITLPAMVNLHLIGEGKSVIDEKVRDLSIYGGLYEKEVVISKGYSARDELPIHIYQDLRHMDTECIDSYVNGGIDHGTIRVFDAWLAEPKNRDRVLPHPKSIVAIKNCLHPKRSEGWSTPPNDTYLYLRNGDNIKRLKSSISIKDTLLATDNAMGAETFVRTYASKTNPTFEFMTANEYEDKLDKVLKLKPIYIQSLLSQHRLEKKFLEGFKQYIEGRKSASMVIERNNNDSIELVQPTDESYGSSIARLNENIAEAVKAIADTKLALEKVMKNKKISLEGELNGSRKHSYTTLMGIHLSGMSAQEIGYIDKLGARHDMPIARHKYEALDNEILAEYASVVKSISAKRDPANYNPFTDQKEIELFKPVNDDHYFFDSIKKSMWANYKNQNELAVLIQGIIDRTDFFGYTEASLFKSGYEDYIKLVYDKKSGLYDGDMPDFKGFIKNLNDNSEAGDLFYGHAEIWSELEDDRRDSYKQRQGYYGYERVSIPPYLKAQKIINKRDGRTVVLFKWQVERDYLSKAQSTHKNMSFECEMKHLINISKYQQGDHKQFIDDPRSRAQYPAWGEKIMMAENFYRAKQDNSL